MTGLLPLDLDQDSGRVSVWLAPLMTLLVYRLRYETLDMAQLTVTFSTSTLCPATIVLVDDLTDFALCLFDAQVRGVIPLRLRISI